MDGTREYPTMSLDGMELDDNQDLCNISRDLQSACSGKLTSRTFQNKNIY